jgi:hypothetical protein
MLLIEEPCFPMTRPTMRCGQLITSDTSLLALAALPGWWNDDDGGDDMTVNLWCCVVMAVVNGEQR